MRNADEIAYWNASAGERWAKWQRQIDVAFSPYADAVLASAAARSGERVLDVGCGSGTLTLALAFAVGESGHATGVDVSQPMLALARQRGRITGWLNHTFLEADASSYAFELGSFSLAVSRFGVMFFDDPVAAFINIRSALAEGGRLVFACWRGAKENPMFSLPRAAVLPLVPEPEPLDPLAPGPTAFASPARVTSVLSEAGFCEVSVSPLDVRMQMGTLAETTEFFLNIGPGSRLLEGASTAVVAEGGRRIESALVPHVASDGGVLLDGAVWIVTARVSEKRLGSLPTP